MSTLAPILHAIDIVGRRDALLGAIEAEGAGAVGPLGRRAWPILPLRGQA